MRELRLFVSQIRVYQFRNLADQSVDLGAGPVFLTGANGNGKTNLVEAVYLLSGSRSFRTTAASDYTRWGATECSVFGRVVGPTGDYEIGLSYRPGKREAFLNGNAVSSVAEVLGKVVVVSFSPSDLHLVKGPPAGRRKFVDRHIVDLHPPVLNAMMAYQRALSSKSALLKAGAASKSDLEPWNALLVRYGMQIAEHRLRFIQDLQSRSAALHAEYAPSDGVLTVELESDFLKDGKLDVGYVESYLDRCSSRELAQRTAVAGPHRDDVAIRLGGADSRSFASQGQARSLVLSLKLGVIDLLEGATQEPPIVLLDDVDSELDAARGERLFDLLMQRERQLLVTGTGEAPYRLKSHPGLTVLKVERGVISKTP